MGAGFVAHQHTGTAPRGAVPEEIRKQGGQRRLPDKDSSNPGETNEWMRDMVGVALAKIFWVTSIFA